MTSKIKSHIDSLDTSEEYFKEKYEHTDEEDQPYFPLEESKPPHY